MAESLLQLVIENLARAIGSEIRLIRGVEQELKKLSSTLSVICSVLEDAEVKQFSDKSINDWLLKLREAAYAINDILDEWKTDELLHELLIESRKRRSRIVSEVLKTVYHINNVVRRRSIGSRISAIRSRIDEIGEERRNFHLREVSSVNGRWKYVDRDQSSSKLSSTEVYGRDEDTKKMVETITKEFADRVKLSVYAVVGMGGIGKTTVVQTAFSNQRLTIHFDPRVWVSVPDDFDLRRILKTIIESASGNACADLDLDPLGRRIQELLGGKRFLLVLDDVWNEDEDKWEKLRSLLDVGSPGSSVVITTRALKVSMVMNKVRDHTLEPLSYEHCWALFRNRAFGEEDEAPRALVSIGRDIVRKCGGIPMAAKALGSLMRFKMGENEWIAIRDSELWELTSSSTSILPSLRVSFSNLPVQLRSCFAYCAVFPRSEVIEKVVLIKLWMANGLIPSEGRLEPEDVGNRVCNELCWRSFFQNVVKDRFGDTLSFTIHDLMHDLARSIMGNECRILSHAAVHPPVTSSTRHATVISGDVGTMITSLGTATESLRTFLQYPLGYIRFPEKFLSAICADYTAFHNLRVLDCSDSNVTELPNEISNLKHLRYLDLSSTKIRELPESISTLVNLQTLMLEYCFFLEELPQQLSSLRQLRHLQIRNCSLTYMPANLGRLSRLQTISNFIVGKDKGSGLEELQYMNLKGELYIGGLYNVSDPENAKKSNLSLKNKLLFLELSWQYGWHPDHDYVPKNVENTIEALQPHSDLRQLCLHGYRGNRFPNWLDSCILHNLVSVELYECINCAELPLLGSLPFLEVLTLTGMHLIRYIDIGKGTDKRFPSLTSLRLSQMRSLLNLLENEENHKEHLHFPQLVELNIAGCPSMTLPWLPSPKGLDISGCNDSLLSSIPRLTSLTSLKISDNDNVKEIELHGLDSLQSLVIISCSKLKSLSDIAILHENSSSRGGGGNVTKDFAPLRRGILPTLQRLYISGCSELDCLPAWLGDSTLLQSLTIISCPRLKTLPKNMEGLDQLHTIRISECPDLQRWCEREIVAHVPNVLVDRVKFN